VVVGIVARMATQKELDEGLEIGSKALVDVEWLDACAHMNVEKIDLRRLSGFLCPTHTMGKVVAQDSNVICVATNISEANGVDLIAIPVRWVKSIQILASDSSSVNKRVRAADTMWGLGECQ
jgi:hypothetical protein